MTGPIWGAPVSANFISLHVSRGSGTVIAGPGVLPIPIWRRHRCRDRLELPVARKLQPPTCSDGTGGASATGLSCSDERVGQSGKARYQGVARPGVGRGGKRRPIRLDGALREMLVFSPARSRADTKKLPGAWARELLPLVAGTGFEPVTFRL